MTAVDWSLVGLANGQAKAAASGVTVEWLARNLFDCIPSERSFDLVALVYLHLRPEEQAPVYNAATAAVAPGGRLLIVGHDRLSATDGESGPSDAERLFTAVEIAHDLVTADP